MVEIYAKLNEEVIDGVKVSYNYFIDEYDVYWIRYIDMVEFLGLSKNRAEGLLTKVEGENVVNDFMSYETDDHGKWQYNLRTFITADAVAYLIDRNNKHNNIFVKSINNLTTSSNDENEIDEIVNNMKKCMEDCNLDALIYNSGKLYNSELGRERMDKLGVIDKDIEEAVDDIRKYMYEKEVKEILLMDENEEIIFELNKYNDAWNNWINPKY